MDQLEFVERQCLNVLLLALHPPMYILPNSMNTTCNSYNIIMVLESVWAEYPLEIIVAIYSWVFLTSTSHDSFSSTRRN